MAEHNYSLTIKNETADENENNPIAGNAAGSKQASGGDNAAAAASTIKAAKIMAVLGTAMHFADKIVSHRIQTVELRTGASEQQERLSFAYSVAKQAGGIIMSTIAGFAVGNAPGALIGFLTSATTTAMSYAQKASELRMQRDLEAVGLKYMNIRAGGSVASYSGSRMKNQ